MLAEVLLRILFVLAVSSNNEHSCSLRVCNTYSTQCIVMLYSIFIYQGIGIFPSLK
jgi:hypothetical protein